MNKKKKTIIPYKGSLEQTLRRIIYVSREYSDKFVEEVMIDAGYATIQEALRSVFESLYEGLREGKLVGQYEPNTLHKFRFYTRNLIKDIKFRDKVYKTLEHLQDT